MKKSFIRITAIAALAVLAGSAYAESQDECAIWLCLPGGFPSGCGAAHSAMISRVRDRKPPLPDFSSCAVNPPEGSGSHMTFADGVAAFIPTHDECQQWSYWGDRDECVRWVTIPARYQKGISCQIDDGVSTPPFCTATKRWVEVYRDGTLAGPTYYW